MTNVTTLGGIYAAVLTPIDDQGDIDVERLAAHCRWLLDRGCHGLGIFGTTSETAAFSVTERKATLEALVAAGISAEVMMVGTGCCARSDTVELSRHAIELGCSRLLMLPPFYYKDNDDEGLFRAFADVIERLGTDDVHVLLYHFPKVSGVPITKGVIERMLRAFPGVFAGLKDSSGDWVHGSDLIRNFPELAIFPGADDLLLDALKIGGAGSISAAANLNCGGNRRVFDAWKTGSKEAETLQVQVGAVRKAITSCPLIPGLKHVLATSRNDSDWARVRPPLMLLDPDKGRGLLADLAAAGWHYEA